jgi:hypothetical protein
MERPAGMSRFCEAMKLAKFLEGVREEFFNPLASTIRQKGSCATRTGWVAQHL